MENVPTVRRGEVYFDAACPFCSRIVGRFRPLFEARGYQFLPLSNAATGPALDLAPNGLPREIKLLDSNGRWRGGIQVIARLLRSVWWLWPAGVLLSLPGFRSVGAWIYQGIAARRYQWGNACEQSACAPVVGLVGPVRLDAPPGRHSAFFVMP